MIYYAKNKKAEAVLDVRELNLLGRHNYENVMAAIAISRAMGVPMETIVKVAKEFKAVEHRIEFVLERSGVKYYNDSKGTNPDAAIQAIRAMPGPTLLIAGGYDKQSTYDEWIEAFDGKVKYLVLIGQTRDKIAECAKLMVSMISCMRRICQKLSVSVHLMPIWGIMYFFPLRAQAGACLRIMRNVDGSSKSVSGACRSCFCYEPLI